MKNAVSSPRVVRFGAYEVDLRCAELRKSGLKIRLTGQPFQVLAILLEHPGELVTRDELQKRLWPGDTFVDFERGLNVAINRVRDALGDTAENPRFVETLPRRGYRFIGNVDGAGSTGTTDATQPRRTQQNQVLNRTWKTGIAAGAGILVVAILFFKTPLHKMTGLGSTAPPELVPLTTLLGAEMSPSFSPDGSQIAFAWNGENNRAGFDLYVKVIGTDKPLRLTNRPAGLLGVAWSPNGNYIAVHRVDTSDSGIFLVPALGGPERKLASTDNLSFPTLTAIAWSPDGKQIAFVDRLPEAMSMRLFLLSLETLERKQVDTECALATEPAFSPAGDAIAYTCTQDDGHFSLRLKELLTGKNIQIVSSLQRVHGTTWSRDGARIIFSLGPAFSPMNGGDLWQIKPRQGESPERMPVGHDVMSPAVGSSGNRLAYVQSQINTSILRVDLNGPQAQTRILASSTRQQFDPVISPDGRRIAFISDRSGNAEIWVCDNDGANVQQLTFMNAGTIGTQRWSPNGKQIVFDARIGEAADVYVIDADGGVPKKLQTGTQMNSLPSWSHDGNWIYFTSGSTHSALTIWRVAAGGGQAVQLTKTPSSMPIESPDGLYVYFVRMVESKFRLWRMRPDGTNETMMDALPPLVSYGFEWMPFQSGIYFFASVNGTPEIDFLDLRTLRIRRIYTMNRPRLPWTGGLAVSPDGKWLAYTQIDDTNSDLMLIKNFR